MASAGVGELGEDGVVLGGVVEVVDGGEGEVAVGVDEFLAALDFGEVEGGVGGGVESADVGDHHGGVDGAVAHELESLLDVVGGAAAGADDVGGGVVDVVEVEAGGEGGVGGAGEEVEAAVLAEDGVALLDDGCDGRHDEDVVVALAVGEGLESFDGVFAGVEIDEPDAVLGGVFGSEDGGGAAEACVVDVGDDEEPWSARAVDEVVDESESHGAGAGEAGAGAALDDAHVVVVGAGVGVVLGVAGADDAAHGFAEAGLEEGVAGVFEEAADLHDAGGDADVGGVAADGGEGVSGGVHGAMVVDGGLDAEEVAGLELVGPLGADLEDASGEFVSEDGGVSVAVVGDALVVGAGLGGLVAGHADGVADDFGDDAVVTAGWQLEGLQTEVHLAVDTKGGGLHMATVSWSGWGSGARGRLWLTAWSGRGWRGWRRT